MSGCEHGRISGAGETVLSRSRHDDVTPLGDVEHALGDQTAALTLYDSHGSFPLKIPGSA